MGRLFWKLFVAFWLSLVLAAVGVGMAVWIYKQVDLDAGDDNARRGGFVGGMGDARMAPHPRHRGVAACRR